MELKKNLILCVLALNLAAAPAVFAEIAKTYQVTGPIVELTDKTIVVMKDSERWEIARDAASKIKGTLKVGQKVTIMYRMTATSVEVKDAAGAIGKEAPAAKDTKRK